MTLFEQIKADQLTARKNKYSLAAPLLTTLLGEASAIGKNDGNRDVTDAEVVALCKKFVKGMDETLGYLGNSNIGASVTIAEEKEILSKYLPKQMTELELEVEVRLIVEEVGSNMGKVMAELKARFGGQYDGKMASSVVKACL